MKLHPNKKGFTLVEILIVIMIVGLLSTMAVGGYTQYRTSTLFGLAIDDLASKVYEMRAKAIYGIGGFTNYEHIKGVLSGDDEIPLLEGGESKCYGVIWTKLVDGTFETRFFAQKFVSKKIWFADKWNYQGCGGVPVESDFRPLDGVDPQFYLKDIKLNDVSVNTLMLRFLPPNGSLEVKANNEEILGLRDVDSLRMEATYGNVDSERRKVIDFNLSRSSYNSIDAENVQ